MTRALPQILGLAALYVALTENLEPLNLVAAVAVGVLVYLLLPAASAAPGGWRRWPARAGAALIYVPLVAIDVIRSGIAVTRLVLRPSLPVRLGVVGTPALPGPEWVRAANAHAVTLTPGELILDMDERTLAVHCLDAPASADSLPAAQGWRRRWLLRIADQAPPEDRT